MYYNLIKVDKMLKIKASRFKGESSVISLRVAKNLSKEIDNISEEIGRTRNDLITQMLEYAIGSILIDK